MRKSGLTGDEAYILSKHGEATEGLGPLKKEIGLIKEDLSNKITKFYASNQGETHITDSDNGKIQDMMLYGKSLQDGTPSPENPVEIKSVVNPAIKICGKNLFDSKKFPIILNRAIDTNTGNVYVSSSGNYCAIEKYIPFPYSGKKVSFNASMSLCAYDKDYKFISAVNKNNGQVPTGTMYVRFDIKIEEKDKAQIELSENATTYEPYKEHTIQLPITLNAIPVSSGGNVTINGQQYVADYVDIEKGKLYRKVKRLNLKDVDDIRIAYGTHSNGNGYLSFSSVEGINKEQRPISNQYKGSTWTSESGYTYIPNDNSIVFVDARFTDRQTAIKLIQDTYVIYALFSQTEEDLSLEQIKSLKSLSTYYPVTNITVGSEELDGYAVFNYPISMKNGWNYVKQQLNDNRDYIYDMDTQSAEAYVNSEYAVALTELEV